MLKHLLHRRAKQSTDQPARILSAVNSSTTSQSTHVCARHAIFHLIPLQLKEVVEIVGVQGRAQVRRCGSLAEIEIRVGRVGFGSERVKSAGLVGVL